MTFKSVKFNTILKKTAAILLSAVLFSSLVFEVIPAYAYPEEELVKEEVDTLYAEMFEEELAEDFAEWTGVDFCAPDGTEFLGADGTELYTDFPESYRPYLVKLHGLFPNWTFVADKINLDFDEVIKQECESDRSLVSITQNNGSYTPSSWKSLETKSFDYVKNEWKTPPSETKGWHYASKEIVSYYLDPRNFLVTTSDNKIRSIFQFLDYSYDAATQTRDGLTAMVSGTFLANEVILGDGLLGAGKENEGKASPSEAERRDAEETAAVTAAVTAAEKAGLLGESAQKSYVDIIMEAAQEYGMNPYVIASFIIQEQGTTGSSELISRRQADFPEIYNYLNVGAYSSGGMTSVQRGLWWAKGQDNGSTSYGRPWNTPEKAIKGGVQYLSEGYLQRGQNTIYYKKFDVKTLPLYQHQYMTNIQGAQAEGWLLGKFYEDNSLQQTAFTFHIPVYENMPEKACAQPTGDGNPNNRLKSLSVDGYSISPVFDMETYAYTVTVGEGTSSVTICADAAAGTTLVAGTGQKYLDSDHQVFKVETTAESGRKGEYTITVTGGTAAVYHTVTWQYEDGTLIDQTRVASGETPSHADPVKEEDSSYTYSFKAWTPAIAPVTEDVVYTAVFTKTQKSSGGTSGGGSTGGGGSSGGGGSTGGGGSSGGGSSSGSGGGSLAGPSVGTGSSASGTFSQYWKKDANGVWRIYDRSGKLITSAWLCDNAVTANGKNVWYLLNTDGTMLDKGLVQDNTGNYYSLEMNHNGYYGMLRYKNGTYDGIYMEFSQKHDGSFGAITNQSAIDALKAKYGVTKFGVGNDSCTYTSKF